METFLSSFLFAAGPLFIICYLVGWVPYFCLSPEWTDAKFNDPIKLGLKSSLYTYTLVAGISASFPPCLELVYYLTVSRGNAINRRVLILTNIFIFILPELLSLKIVSPTSDSKLYFLLLNSRLSTTIFFAMLLLCYFSGKSWKCKLSTIAVSFIYIGLLMNSWAPYSDDIMEIWVQKLGTYLQFIGCILFIIKSYKFLRTNSVTTESEDFMIFNDLLCKFIILSVLFIIVGLFSVYLSAGMPYWTQWDSTYITCYTIILALPNVLLGVALAHATRNEAVNLQASQL